MDRVLDGLGDHRWVALGYSMPVGRLLGEALVRWTCESGSGASWARRTSRGFFTGIA